MDKVTEAFLVSGDSRWQPFTRSLSTACEAFGIMLMNLCWYFKREVSICKELSWAWAFTETMWKTRLNVKYKRVINLSGSSKKIILFYCDWWTDPRTSFSNESSQKLQKAFRSDPFHFNDFKLVINDDRSLRSVPALGADGFVRSSDVNKKLQRAITFDGESLFAFC